MTHPSFPGPTGPQAPDQPQQAQPHDGQPHHGAPQQYGAPQAYGAPQQHGAPQAYGAPQQYGAPPAYGYGGTPQAPYGGPHYPPPVPPHTEGTAIAALVCGLTVAPVGIILGIVALGRIRRSGAKGRGMAISGIVLGSLSIIAAVALVVFAATGAFDTSPESITSERSIAADDLQDGHCANLSDLDDAGTRVKVVPCSAAHDTEILADVGQGQLIAGMIDAQMTLGPQCAELAAELAGADADRLDIYILPVAPPDSADGLSTRYLCAASAPSATINGSFLLGDAQLS